MNAYIAKYWATDGRRLIGDVSASQSSPWGTREMAEQYLQNVIRLNGPGCAGAVVTVDGPPVHFRHCGDTRKPVTTIGCRCFSCGKILTEADATAFDEAAGICVYKEDQNGEETSPVTG